MKDIGSRDFQLTYQKLEEPVRVISKTSADRVIGYFYPGSEPPCGPSKEDMTIDDFLGTLAEQDRAYMQRKMGKKGKK